MKDKAALAKEIDDIEKQEPDSSVSIGEEKKTLMIPKIGLKEEIFEGDESALELGVWHKFPERSDPSIGGNFVLVGHRFNFGLTPGETKRKSPLYNVDQVEVGDSIIVEWNGKIYKYIVTAREQVTPNQIEVERNTRDSRLTIYTCTLGGRYDGREVIVAKPENKST